MRSLLASATPHVQPAHSARKALIVAALAGLVLALLLLPRVAAAESWTCNTVGAAPLEQLEHEGRAVQVTNYTCRVAGGLLDGFVATATNIWEFNKGAARLLVASGTMRKPGAMLVFQADGTQNTIMHEGRAVGWQSAGTGIYKFASGSAAALAGKSFTFVARPRGHDMFIIETDLKD